MVPVLSSGRARPAGGAARMGEDIRELSFQAVLDNILKPAGVHVGGYPEDIFIDLTEEERDKWNCNIWCAITTTYVIIAYRIVLYYKDDIRITQSRRIVSAIVTVEGVSN